MKTLKTILLLGILIYSHFVKAQINEKPFSLSINYGYITTSKLFMQPNSMDPILKNMHQEIDDIYSISSELRYKFYESLIVGLKIELVKKIVNNDINLGGILIPIEEGYRVIPVELSLLYQLPFSSNKFIFFMGGGVGIYSGEHIRNLGNVKAVPDKKEITFGIHVQFGMDYTLYDFLAIRGEMFFRDPEFVLNSSYSKDKVIYQNNTYSITSPKFSSKVNIDGVTFSIGAVINF